MVFPWGSRTLFLSETYTYAFMVVEGDYTMARAAEAAELQPEQFAKTTRLRTANGNFGLLLVVHAEHVARFEPRHHFADVIDVHQVGTMRAPEGVWIELREQFLQGAAIGLSFHLRGGDTDDPVFDG